MKIIEGSLAGTIINYKEQKGTRVTSEKVRKAVFDVLKGLVDFEGIKTADPFCGSGMYGIECLSRGVNVVWFLDEDKKVIKILRRNLSQLKVESYPPASPKLSFGGRGKVESKKFENFIKTCNDKFDLIFADPPYYQFDFEKLNDIYKILNPNGIFVLEQSKRGGTKKLNGLKLFLEKKYGDTKVLFFRKK